jgi:hypothetical protein
VFPSEAGIRSGRRNSCYAEQREAAPRIAGGPLARIRP